MTNRYNFTKQFLGIYHFVANNSFMLNYTIVKIYENAKYGKMTTLNTRKKSIINANENYSLK